MKLRFALKLMVLGGCLAVGLSNASAQVATDGTIVARSRVVPNDQLQAQPQYQAPACDFDCCAEDCSEWSARVGALLLKRTHPAPQPFLVNANNNNSSIINASDYNFPIAGSVDFGLRRHGDCGDWDFRYFGTNPATANVGPILAPAGLLMVAPGQSVSPDPILVNSWLANTLQSAELNLRREITSNFAVLAGVRYLQFRDSVSASLDVGPNIGDVWLGFDGRNEMLGFQLGADSNLWQINDLVSIEASGKAGLFGNAASGGYHFDAGSNAFALNSSRNTLSFVGDVNLAAVFQLTDNLLLRAGYQLLWLGGVATALEQVPRSDFNAGTISADSSGSAFFHGAMFGLEYGW